MIVSRIISEQFYFSSGIPTFTFPVGENDSALVEIHVGRANLEMDDTCIFRSLYYAYNGRVLIYDVRSILETYMEIQDVPIANFRIVCRNVTIYLTVIYARYKIRNCAPIYFLHNSFFTSLTDRLCRYEDRIRLTWYEIPHTIVENTSAAESSIRDTDMAEEMVNYSNNNILAQASQSMLNQESEDQSQNTGTINRINRAADDAAETSSGGGFRINRLVQEVVVLHYTYRLANGRVESRKETTIKDFPLGLTHKTLNFRYLLRHKIPLGAEPLSVTYCVGNRCCSFYFVKYQHWNKFYFKNIFNCFEAAYIPSSTTTKTSTEYSSSTCLGEQVQYDIEHKQTFEVQSAALPYPYALWLNEMFTSKDVRVHDSRYCIVPAMPRILIMDYESKLTDAPAEENAVKFTWCYTSLAIPKELPVVSPLTETNTEYTIYNILEQAGQTMLADASQFNENVLSLLQ